MARGGFHHPDQDKIDEIIEKRDISFRTQVARANARIQTRNITKYLKSKPVSNTIKNLMKDIIQKSKQFADAEDFDAEIFIQAWGPVNKMFRLKWEEHMEAFEDQREMGYNMDTTKAEVLLNEIKMDHLIVIKYQMRLLGRHLLKIPQEDLTYTMNRLSDMVKELKTTRAGSGGISTETQNMIVQTKYEAFLRAMNDQLGGEPLNKKNFLYSTDDMFRDVMEKLEEKPSEQPPAEDEPPPADDNAPPPPPPPEPESSGIEYENVESSPEHDPIEPESQPRAPTPPPVSPQPVPASPVESPQEFSDAIIYESTQESDAPEEHVPPREDTVPYFSYNNQPNEEFLKEFDAYWLRRHKQNWARFRSAPSLARWAHAVFLDSYLAVAYGPSSSTSGYAPYWTETLNRKIHGDDHLTYRDADRIGIDWKFLYQLSLDVDNIVWSRDLKSTTKRLVKKINTSDVEAERETARHLLFAIQSITDDDDDSYETETGLEWLQRVDRFFIPYEEMDNGLVPITLQQEEEVSDADYDNEPLPPKVDKNPHVVPEPSTSNVAESSSSSNVVTESPWSSASSPPTAPDDIMLNPDILPTSKAPVQPERVSKIPNKRFDPLSGITYHKRATAASSSVSRASGVVPIPVASPDIAPSESIMSSPMSTFGTPMSFTSSAPTIPSPLLKHTKPPPTDQPPYRTRPPGSGTRTVPLSKGSYTGQTTAPRKPPVTPSPSRAAPPPVPPIPQPIPVQPIPQPRPVPPSIFVTPTLWERHAVEGTHGARNHIEPGRARAVLATTFHNIIADAGVRIPANRLRDVLSEHWLYTF
jgi:hypothetical protein